MNLQNIKNIIEKTINVHKIFLIGSSMFSTKPKDLDVLIISNDFEGFNIFARRQIIDSIGISNLDAICLTIAEFNQIKKRKRYFKEKIKEF